MSLPEYPLVFFDVDSTLVTVEGIDVLAGGKSEIAALTERAMTGAIPIEQVYARRLELARPTRQRVEKLAQTYLQSIVPRSEEVLRRLGQARVEVHLVTAGIEQAVGPLAEHLGIDRRFVHAVALEFDPKGRYRDFDRTSPLTRSRGKETVVRDVRARSHGKALYVGDGVTDLDVKEVVDLFVGFGGVRVRERVRREADVFVKDLEEILPLVFGERGVQRIRKR
jgi:phosphoserine phosphatase